MNDDDLYAPKLSAPPATSAIVRGAAAVVVTVALATTSGCNPGTPPLVVDAGISVPPDAGNDVGAPGVGPLDAGP